MLPRRRLLMLSLVLLIRSTEAAAQVRLAELVSTSNPPITSFDTGMSTATVDRFCTEDERS